MKTLFELAVFNDVMIVMAILGLVVLIALYFVGAGYGMMYNKKWGPSVNNKLGWVLMESPVFIVMLVLWLNSSRTFEAAPLVFCIFFEIHYLQRSFIFPFLLKGKNKMPLAIVLMGIVFNIVNAYLQGGWILYLAPDNLYTVNWLYTPQFIIGVSIFLAGMVVNLNSDYIIRHLRKEGDSKHYIPRGGLFKYVSSANYLGELLEWIGFAVFTWSAAGAVFAWWTFANLAPRAWRIHRRYSTEFGDEFDKLHLKRIIPFIY